MSPNSSHYSSAGSEVEIHRREALRLPGDRRPLTYQERNKDSIIKEEGPLEGKVGIVDCGETL
jgi:hypothetical protein